MTSILDRVASQRPDTGAQIAFAKLTGTIRMPLTELWEQAGELAKGLRRLGLGRGDRLGVMAGNSLEWVLLDLAAVRLGAVTAGLEPGKFQADAELLSRYGLAAVFSDQLDEAEAAAGYHRMSEVATLIAESADEPEPPPVHRAANEPAALKFTSGSTGVPKSLTASVGSVDSSIEGVQELFTHGPGDDIFVFLPLSLLQQRYWIYSALWFGHDVTVSSYEAALFTLGKARPTVVMGVPAFFEAMQRQIESRAAGRVEANLAETARELFGDRIRYLWTGSAPANPGTLEFFTSCGLPIFEGYGMNETCIATKNAPGAVKLGSVGRPLRGKRVLIGEDGVVHISSDHPVATRYEHAKPGDSERIFLGDGLVRTGDLGYLDQDGYLYLTGRADDVIVLGNGRKVVVRPIEEFMKRSAAIGECVLFCPNESRLVAVVSPATDPVDVAAIAAQLKQCNDAMTADEQIHRLVVADPPFSIDNGLFTSQHKPRRREIGRVYEADIINTGKGIHVN
jgi:long-chain acyl-CoA synthetase